MKLAFLINSLTQPAGTERVTTVIANELVKTGHEVSIFSVQNDGKPFFELEKSISVQYLGSQKRNNIYLHYPLNIFRLRKLIRKNKIDVIIDVCSAMSLMSIPATFFSKAKVVTWEHFNANVNWNPITSPSARKLAVLFSRKIVTLTNADKHIFENRYKAKNVVVIPNPITISAKATTDLQSKVILAVGRLEEQKGFDMLLSAWKLCQCKERGWRLKIVGSGSLENELLAQITEEKIGGTVSIEKPVQDVVGLYSQASLFAMSSRFEGLPLVLIEAMSVGLPAVSFDCETGPRDIIQDKITGELVPANDVAALAEAMDRLTANPELLKIYSENAIKRSKNFEIKPIMQKWEELILQLK